MLERQQLSWYPAHNGQRACTSQPTRLSSWSCCQRGCVGTESGTDSLQDFLVVIHSSLKVITGDKSYGNGQVTTDAGGGYRWKHLATNLYIGSLDVMVTCCWKHWTNINTRILTRWQSSPFPGWPPTRKNWKSQNLRVVREKWGNLKGIREKSG